MTGALAADRESGFVLVEALVALAILAVAGTTIYQMGFGLISRVDRDLDRSAAVTNLHAIASVLQARGTSAVELVATEDELLRYRFAEGPKEEQLSVGVGSGFYWATIEAVDQATGRQVISLSLGYHG